MQKHFILTATTAVALVLCTPALASATEACIPTDAWTETIEVSPEIPAIGEPTITIEHPAVIVHHEAVIQHHEAVTVDHPAVTVDHPAVTQTQWKYVKNGGYGFVWLDNNDHHKVKINGHWYQRTSHTQVITISEAWTETVSEAWTEVITEAYDEVITEAYDEVITEAWSETVPNPDYVPAVPAVTETVEHEAITCPVPEEGAPVVPEEEPEEPVVPEEEPEEPVVPEEEPEEPVVPEEEPEEPVVPEEEPEEPVVPEKEPEEPVIEKPSTIPAASAPTPTPAAAKNELAVTGSNDALLPIGALALAAMVAGGTMMVRRARSN